MTESIWRFIAKSWAPECFSLSSTITDTAHSTSVLVWPLRMTFGMGYRCYKTMASDSLQIRWTRWLWFYLTPSKTTMVLSKRLHTMVDNKWSLLTNRGKESSAMLANFPSNLHKTISNRQRLNASELRTRILGDSTLACLHQKYQYLRQFWPDLENSFLS